MSALAGAVGAVVQGRRGRLFLGRQDGFDLGRFTDGSALPPSLLAQWRATLTRRGKALSARGIPYIFMIAPDAPSVCFEDLPDEYPGPYHTPGRVFLEAMGEIPGVRFVYPVEALRSARGGLDVYQLTDSHWTTFGSGVAYRELMRTIAETTPCQVVPMAAARFTFRSSFGDLGSQCQPERRSEIPVAMFDGPEPERLFDYVGAQRQTATATQMPGAPMQRVLAFRDSFMTDLAPYLARSFSDLLMVGTTTRVMLDAVDDWGADVVISEVAERRLVAFESDHQIHRYEWLYMTDHSDELGKGMLRALNLLAAGDVNSAAGIVRAECPDNPPPAHAYSAAVILEAAGDHAAAGLFADAALAAEPQNSAALALAARVRLATNRATEAVQLLAWAAEDAPWNGAIRELEVYSLMQANQPVAALAVAEDALLGIRDHANLWYWTAVLREASGRHEDAFLAVQNAIEFDPCNPAYNDLHARLSTVRQPHDHAMALL